MRGQGMTVADIARQAGLPYPVVYRAVTRAQKKREEASV